MTETVSRSQDLRRALRRVHRGVLATLAACALVIAATGGPAVENDRGAVDRRYTLAALALGIGSILARRQAAAPRVDPRLRPRLALAALLLAGAIGGVGVALALAGAEREIALLYTLGGAILALRGPSSSLPPDPPRQVETP